MFPHANYRFKLNVEFPKMKTPRNENKPSFADQYKSQSNDSHPSNPNLSENMRKVNFLRLVRKQTELFDKICSKNNSDIDILSGIVSINNEAINLSIQNGSTEP